MMKILLTTLLLTFTFSIFSIAQVKEQYLNFDNIDDYVASTSVYNFAETQVFSIEKGKTNYNNTEIIPPTDDLVSNDNVTKNNTSSNIKKSVASPVQLSTFDTEIHEVGIALDWQISSEENNVGFDIEKSADGKNWETLDFVPGKSTTVNIQNYKFIDAKPYEGKNYYRLKQLDFEANFKYSEVININIENNLPTTTIYPNPVQNELLVSNVQNMKYYVIYNDSGQVIQLANIDEKQLIINTKDFKKGIYFIKLQNENGKMVSKQFVK